MKLLDISEVTKFFGGLCAVSDVSFSIDTNELVALIGPNGAGKTTLFNLITGMYQASKGSILFKGKEIGGLPMHEIAMRGIARVFQLSTLFFSISVLENIMASNVMRSSNGKVHRLLLGLNNTPEREQEAEELLKVVGLQHRKNVLAGKLPYGEQRSLALVSALATKPSLLLLDEPTVGMNPEEIHRWMDLILSLRREKGLTVIIVEHNMEVVMGIAERVIVFNFGEMIADGPPEEIKKNGRVVESYLGGEFAPVPSFKEGMMSMRGERSSF